jgi:catechol 2,3-dioxygenase-like lactoylglutathione lyase family enzyme
MTNPQRTLRTVAAVLDHVAVAVPDTLAAEVRWREQLGGGCIYRGLDSEFAYSELWYPGRRKLELMSPASEPHRGFVGGFLERFGSGIHHLTVMVSDFSAALDILTEAGLDVVDVNRSDPNWPEAFLRPTQAGGIVIQVVWSGLTDEGWAADEGQTPEQPAPDSARLLGPTLSHDDLERARWLWTVLGATVEESSSGLRCTWPGDGLDVVVEAGEHAGPKHLRFTGTDPLPADPRFGPAVEEGS